MGQQWWREGYACECLIQVVEQLVEPAMRAAGLLDGQIVIYQQSYNTSVNASAGTHSGGGAIDTARYGSDAELTIWRESGVAYWPRGDDLYGDGMDPHCHGIVCGCPHLSSAAADQVDDYRAGRNGLANNGPDPGPDVPYIEWDDALAAGGAGGMLGMTEITKFSRNDDQRVAAGAQWQTVKIDDDGALSLLTGPVEAYLATVGVAVSGLPAGVAAQFRLRSVYDYADDRPTETASDYPVTEVIGTAGHAFGTVTFANDLKAKPPSGAKTRLRLVVSPPEDTDITITAVTTRVLT